MAAKLFIGALKDKDVIVMSVNGDKVTEDGRILTDRGQQFVMFALDPTVIYTFSPTSPVGNYLKLAHAIS